VVAVASACALASWRASLRASLTISLVLETDISAFVRLHIDCFSRRCKTSSQFLIIFSPVEVIVMKISRQGASMSVARLEQDQWSRKYVYVFFMLKFNGWRSCSSFVFSFSRA
jgi:hypothetical protein